MGQKSDVFHAHEVDENNMLITNLRDISHLMRSLYEGKGSQRRILIVLNTKQSITQRELTKYLGIQPGSVSEVLAKLEAAGLILRSPSESDRRTVDISLTPSGRTAAQEAITQRRSRHQEMFACLSAEEKTLLLQLLQKINMDWKKRYGSAAGRGHRPHNHGHCCETE